MNAPGRIISASTVLCHSERSIEDAKSKNLRNYDSGKSCPPRFEGDVTVPTVTGGVYYLKNNTPSGFAIAHPPPSKREAGLRFAFGSLRMTHI